MVRYPEASTEKRKVGGSTPPLATVLELRKQARSGADRACLFRVVHVGRMMAKVGACDRIQVVVTAYDASCCC